MQLRQLSCAWPMRSKDLLIWQLVVTYAGAQGRGAHCRAPASVTTCQMDRSCTLICHATLSSRGCILLMNRVWRYVRYSIYSSIISSPNTEQLQYRTVRVKSRISISFKNFKNGLKTWSFSELYVHVSKINEVSFHGMNWSSLSH